MASEKSRSFHRRLKSEARLFTGLIGGLALVVALVVFAMSFSHPRGLARTKIQKISQVLVLTGGALLLVRLAFVLGDRLSRRKSPSFRRRDSIYGRSRWQPKSGESPVVPGSGGKSGSVLVVVLAVLAGVAALVLQVQLTARARHSRQEAELRRSGLLRAADDAARAALHRLAADEDLLSDSDEEPWARREERRTPLGLATLVTVADENRRYDLNNVARRSDLGARTPDEVLISLLYVCGIFDTGERVRALQDWVDEDRKGAHESDAYSQRRPPYVCPDRPLLSSGELLLIDGWNRGLFEKKAPVDLGGAFNANPGDCLTVIPEPAGRLIPVNVNTASRAVLLGLLGIENDVLANAILSLRKIDRIRSIDAIQQLMEPALFARVSPYLAVRSEWFRIDAQAFSDGSTARVRALAHREGDGRVTVVQWMTGS